MRLKDKVTIITGAGQGIGAAYARKLAGEGAIVVVAEIDEEKAKAIAGEINAMGFEAYALKTDVSDEQSTQRLARKVIDRYGRIDVLINNAAVFSTIKTKPAESSLPPERPSCQRPSLARVIDLTRVALSSPTPSSEAR